MNLRKTITATLATGTLLLGSMTPAFAADVVIAGNGAGSQSSVNVSSNHEMSMYQRNNTDISNFVLANALTGGNTSSGNTGGNSSVTSGAAHATVGISNEGGLNILSMNHCGCDQMANTVQIIGNGAGSHNGVNVSSNHEMHQSQVNNSDVTNTVVVNAETGGNTSVANTGSTQSAWHPFMSNHNWTTTWNPSVHAWMLQNGWAWHDNQWVYTGITGGSTTVTSGPASTHVTIINDGNANMMH